MTFVCFVCFVADLSVAQLPPAVTVHGLGQAKTALAPNLPVLLLSAEGAAAYAGAAWWRAMIGAALEGRHAPDALDCSDLAGRALEALHCGCRIIILHPCPAYPAIVERAMVQHAGAALVLSRRPLSLDLDHPGAHRRLEPWLRGDSDPSVG